MQVHRASVTTISEIEELVGALADELGPCPQQILEVLTAGSGGARDEVAGDQASSGRHPGIRLTAGVRLRDRALRWAGAGNANPGKNAPLSG